MHVCMYVLVCVCTYVRMYVRMYVCMYMHHTYTCVCVCANVRARQSRMDPEGFAHATENLSDKYGLLFSWALFARGQTRFVRASPFDEAHLL